jgi:hypothetical protein
MHRAMAFSNFRQRIGNSLSLLSVFFIAVSAVAANKPSEAQLAAITARGRLLAAFDEAAWKATDAVQATQPPQDSVQRYIARKAENGWIVDFGRLNDSQDKFIVAYEAVQSGPSAPFTVKRLDPVREDTGWNLVAAKAVDAALADFRGEDRPYNAAELPDDSTGLYVYVYPAQVKADVYPLGGDVRYHFAANGSLLEKRGLHKGILEPAPLPPGTTPAGGYHTHVLSDLPEDTDVFLVLTRKPRMPEFVAAGKLIYKVNVDGSISNAGPLK